jgi:hypothetical protein
MGLESEPVRIRAAGGPTRCPFCHADVLREEEAWVACDGCLARHHTGCWGEGKGCANCGETRFLSREQALSKPAQNEPAQEKRAEAATPPTLAPVTEGELPMIQLELRGERGSIEGHERLPLIVRPGVADEPVELALTNATDRPHRVELRHLPAWVTARETAQEIAPGATARIRLEVHAARVPFQTVAGNDDKGNTRGVKNPVPDQARGTFVVATEEDSRAVALDVERALGDSELWSYALLMALIFHVGIAFAAIHASRGRRPVREAGESLAEHLAKARRADAHARLARRMRNFMCFTIPILAAIVTTLILVGRR